MTRNLSFSVLFLFLLASSAYGQEFKPLSEILFKQGAYAIEPDFHNNQQACDSIISLLQRIERDTTLTLSKVEIDAYASPEGGKQYNEYLSKRRVDAISDFLLQQMPSVSSYVIKNSKGIAWQQLRDSVAASDMEYKTQVLNIIDNVPEETYRNRSLIDSRLKQLMDLKWGRPYVDMSKNIFPHIRRANTVTVYYKKEIPVIVPRDTIVVIEEVLAEPIKEPEVAPVDTVVEIRKPLFAIKTNLLYDAASALNVEIEVPIGQRWSVAGEWIFPWWKSGKRDVSIQMLMGNLEVKYWLGDRSKKDLLTGWSVGAYGGAGLFDMQGFNKKGIQSDLFFATGLSAGFAHRIGKVLRMEYSVGVGYMQTDYKQYELVRNTEHGDIKVWDYPWEERRHRWIGPTKAKIALVWLLDYKTSKKGNKR